MADGSHTNLEALYQELILDHYRRPRNKGTLEYPDARVAMKNPLCGDVIDLQLVFGDDGTVADVRFTGQGCSISQASTSMMTELIKGKRLAEVERLRDRFRAMIMGDATAAADASLGRARALSGVARYPARVKCALLAWNALDEGLRSHAARNAAGTGNGPTGE